ncbi:aquaporin-12-like [Amblyraja radiata]|uniref:aquaporin-12-like n=1 Tax=Amblyraja radiata TaxID=386614 RepID=UPI00140308A9|nr:aquaporin-12-like [Amblyraja radiata]
MAGLNVSCGYFFAVLALCQVVRMVSRRLLPLQVYIFLAELATCFQLGAFWLELRMLVVIGPWGGGFGMDVVLTLLFILFLIHEATLDGAQANPLITLQELLRSNSSLAAATLKTLSQFGGTHLASVVARVYWSWELTDFHLIQNMMAIDCSSAIQTSVSHGALAEAACAFLFHLVVMKFEGAALGYRILSKALTITALVYTAGPYTTALFNPALAFSVTFHCSGNTLLEYMLVYWLSPLIATTLAVLLFNGNIPLVFSKNLLYSQRPKYKIPKGKSTLGPEENKTANRQQARKRNIHKKVLEVVMDKENN